MNIDKVQVKKNKNTKKYVRDSLLVSMPQGILRNIPTHRTIIYDLFKVLTT